MFYIHSGCYSDFSVHACTEDEELAKLYCAVHNSGCVDSYEFYDYSNIDKLEDMFAIDKSLVNMFCTSEIKVDIDNGQYFFYMHSKFINAKTDYRFKYNKEGQSYELVADSVTEVKDGKDKYDNTLKRLSMVRDTKRGEDGKRKIIHRITINNFITNSNDDKVILKSAEDYFYSMLALTDGIVDIDKWNAHEILTKGSKYKRFISIWVDINSWDFTPDTVDNIKVEVYRDYISSVDEYGMYPSKRVHFAGVDGDRTLSLSSIEGFHGKGLYIEDIEIVRDFDTNEELYDRVINMVKKSIGENVESLKKEYSNYCDSPLHTLDILS